MKHGDKAWVLLPNGPSWRVATCNINYVDTNNCRVYVPSTFPSGWGMDLTVSRRRLFKTKGEALASLVARSA